MNKCAILENKDAKIVKSKGYNYMFRKSDGFFMRWGKTKEDDALLSPFGPEIMDIEITTKCRGISAHGPCKFCYKSNTANGINMSFDTFKNILDKLPRTLTQLAIGADAQAESNPDLWNMMVYARSKDIIPNITVAEISDETADKLATLCGAVAVSYYDLSTMTASIRKLKYACDKLNRKMQINVHALISEETFDKTMDLLKLRAAGTDSAVNEVNAFVLLSLKKKGRGKSLNSLPQSKFNELVDYAMANNIPVGFDSCSAFKFLAAVSKREDYNKFEKLAEPCESTCFSMYVNAEGKFFPCSFTEDEDGWEGIDLTKINDFLEDVWYNDKVKDYRNKIISCRNCNQSCFHFKI